LIDIHNKLTTQQLKLLLGKVVF